MGELVEHDVISCTTFTDLGAELVRKRNTQMGIQNQGRLRRMKRNQACYRKEPIRPYIYKGVWNFAKNFSERGKLCTLLMAMLVGILYFFSSNVMAQSWSGTVGAIKIEIAARSNQGKPSFVVYVGQNATQSLIIKNCGSMDKGSGVVLFCSDDANNDVNKFGGSGSMYIANYYNLRFSSNGRDYECVATTQRSPLFCRIKANGANAFNSTQYRLDSLLRN